MIELLTPETAFASTSYVRAGSHECQGTAQCWDSLNSPALGQGPFLFPLLLLSRGQLCRLLRVLAELPPQLCIFHLWIAGWALRVVRVPAGWVLLLEGGDAVELLGQRIKREGTHCVRAGARKSRWLPLLDTKKSNTMELNVFSGGMVCC